MSYTKLANSILTSTLWMEDDHTRIAWLTLLAMADKNGEVQASIPGFANVARIPVESARAAIAKFLSPDPDSRTKDDEGRRIQEIKGGWLLINHAEYRQLASDEDRKAKAAERQQRMRDKLRRNASPSTVTPESHQKSQAEAEADTNSEAEAVNPPTPVPGEVPLDSEKAGEPKGSSSPVASMIGSWFNRRSSTPWSKKEVSALQTICRNGLASPEDLELMGWYYLESGCQYLRRDVMTLLNNWNGELDRARAARAVGGCDVKDVEKLKDQIAYHPANRDWVGYNADTVTDEQKAELANLKSALARLEGRAL